MAQRPGVAGMSLEESKMKVALPFYTRIPFGLETYLIWHTNENHENPDFWLLLKNRLVCQPQVLCGSWQQLLLEQGHTASWDRACTPQLPAAPPASLATTDVTFLASVGK